MYLGGILILLGATILSHNLSGLIPAFFFFSIINWMFIPFEENKMEKTFGQKYLDYKNKIRRWI
jgi:protein-S-isoprenylcysteine O-methyltransferase Ste14